MDGGGLVYKKPGNFVNLCFCYFDTTLEMKWRTRVAFVSFVALLLLFLVFSILHLLFYFCFSCRLVRRRRRRRTGHGRSRLAGGIVLSSMA